MRSTLELAVSSVLAVGTAQQAIPFEFPTRLVDHPPSPAPAWFSGDTHEHVQQCDAELHPLDEILLHMEAVDLNVANVLIWERPTLPFTELVCRVTGEPDPLSTPLRVLQYGVETAGLDCAKWGHVTALGLGPEEARIAAGALKSGDCAEMPGLGLGCEGGDGTGALNGVVARHLAAPGVVCGYAHTFWTLGLQHPAGYDWQTELLDTGFTTDARFLDPGQKLAVPDLGPLLDVDAPAVLHGGPQRAFFPLLGAMDAVLGNVQFFETTFLGATLPVTLSPPANWNGLYYKLLSAGVRIGLSGGSDRACPTMLIDEYPRTHVFLEELSYAGWIEGLAAGRTTVGVPGIRIDLTVDGLGVGEELDLPRSADVPILVEVHSTVPLSDVLEIVVDGEVVEQQTIQLPMGGATLFALSSPTLSESTWVAARLGSQRAHTGAVYVIVDEQPIADGPSAEYWMLWCDIVEKTALDHPELAMFECQEGEALALVEQARRAFQALRDVEGFDPEWGVDRRGESTPACRGPIAIGTTGPLIPNTPFRATCVHAPPSAPGELIVSRRAEPSGPCVDGVRLFVSIGELDVIGVFPTLSTPSGYAEVEVPGLGPEDSQVHLQFRWLNPPGCESRPCSGTGPHSASDALRMLAR